MHLTPTVDSETWLEQLGSSMAICIGDATPLLHQMHTKSIPELTCVEDTDYIKKAPLLQSLNTRLRRSSGES